MAASNRNPMRGAPSRDLPPPIDPTRPAPSQVAQLVAKKTSLVYLLPTRPTKCPRNCAPGIGRAFYPSHPHAGGISNIAAKRIGGTESAPNKRAESGIVGQDAQAATVADGNFWIWRRAVVGTNSPRQYIRHSRPGGREPDWRVLVKQIPCVQPDDPGDVPRYKRNPSPTSL